MASLAARRNAEMVRITIGSMLGLLVTGFATHWLFGPAPLTLLLAPMGASAVLMFGIPSSPLAQPWSILGGNLFAGLIGVFVYSIWPSQPLIAAPVALAATLCLTTLLRCVHPPAGAVALTAVLGGPQIHELGYWFIVNPLMVNSALLLMMAILYNNLTGHRYPATLRPQHTNVHETQDPVPTDRAGFLPEDLEAALEEYEGMLAVGPEELDMLLRKVEQHAHKRQFGKLASEDIMSIDLVLVNQNTPLAEASRLMEKHRLHTLPVIEPDTGRMVGVVDYTSISAHLHSDTMIKLGRLALRHPLRSANTVDTLARGHDEQTVSRGTPVETLVPMMADGGHHAAYVVDDDARLCGIVTQSDLIAALYRGRIGEQPKVMQAA